MDFKDYLLETELNECTSVGITIENNVLLAKNRDRTYNPTIKIIRELIDGTEVIYMYDTDTDYSEGMNEYGIGIVNTTLQGKEDEKALKITNTKKKLNEDGDRVRRALRLDNVTEILKSLEKYKGGLNGHTVIGHKDGFVSVEKIKGLKPRVRFLKKNEVIVRTNHGIIFPRQGYQTGRDRESSISRMFYATRAARRTEHPDELLVMLRKHHGTLGYLEPYRTNYKVWTSSQIMLNLTKLEMTFIVDENTKFIGVENRLPTDYKAKIKLNLYKVNTEYKASKLDGDGPGTEKDKEFK